MTLQKPNLNIRSLTQILSIAFLSIAFSLAMTACSSSTKPAENKPAETNTAAVNSATPNASPKAAESAGGDLSGTYAVTGSGADGASYQGDLLVTKRDSVYQLSWKLGADSYDGVGVQSGNALAAAYTTGTDGKGCGAVVYKIGADGSLDGVWGEWGVNTSGTEKAVQIGESSGGVGTFNVTGTNGDGSTYKGTLAVTKGANDVYQFMWATGTSYTGTGVKMGDYLAAGSGAKQCGFVIYEVKGKTLEGKWGVPGSTSLGTERASKK